MIESALGRVEDDVASLPEKLGFDSDVILPNSPLRGFQVVLLVLVVVAGCALACSEPATVSSGKTVASLAAATSDEGADKVLSTGGRPFPTIQQVRKCNNKPGGPIKFVRSTEWAVKIPLRKFIKIASNKCFECNTSYHFIVANLNF